MTDPTRASLEATVAAVRRRWRTRLLVRGLLQVLVAGVLAIVAASMALEMFRFSPQAVWAVRGVMLGLLGVAAWWGVVRPFRRQASDAQVALYLEEHEPSLNSALLTALSPPAELAVSPRLRAGLLAAVDEALSRIDQGRRIDRGPLQRWSLATALVSGAAIALLVFGPALLRQTLSALLVWTGGVEAASPYRITVTPGDARVPQGSDQTVRATLDGFTADEVLLHFRPEGSEAFMTAPMLKTESGAYEGLLFDLATSTEYYVDGRGVRSTRHRFTTVELPAVKTLSVRAVYPAYTGREPEVFEDATDLAVLRGTQLEFRVTPTIPATGGALELGGIPSVAMTVATDGTVTAAFTPTADGTYRIALTAPSGEQVIASPQYAIDVLDDQRPTVRIVSPGRDTDATPVQEFAVRVAADDDYAVRQLELVYAVNGGAEQSVRLFGGARATTEVTVGHTWYFEELGLKAGDAVSYYARATDNSAQAGPQRSTSDMYFVRVRPFDKDFKPATSMGGGGGGGGGGMDQVGGLSQQQRQIVSGTFNVQRDRATLGPAKTREGLTVLTLSQSRVREQVEGLVTRMTSQLAVRDPAFGKITELLPQAAAAMALAEQHLQAQSAERALPHEQRALQLLQQAEEEFELQVQTRQNSGGGGGGNSGSMADDLSDLFKMELDKMASQYETSQRALQQQGDAKVDELAERLKDLARRQEQELERQRRMASGQGPRVSGGDLQRALAEQAEEAARQLERLSREQSRDDLGDSARQMREAAQAMRQAASGGAAGQGQAASAAQRLREAQRQLQRAQGDRNGRDLREAQRQADEIAAEQSAIAEDVNDLPNAGADRLGRAQLIGQRKDALEQSVARLEQELDRLSNETGREAPEVSRELAEAANSLRQNQVRDKIRYAKRAAQGGAPEEFMRSLEAQIGVNIDEMRERIGAASDASQQQQGRRGPDALERTRDLTRRADSMSRRLDERTRRMARTGTPDARDGQGTQGRDGARDEGGADGRTADRNQPPRAGQQGAAAASGRDGAQRGSGQEGTSAQNGQAGAQGREGNQQGGQQGQDAAGGRGDASGGVRGGRGGALDGGGDWWREPGDYWTGDDIRQFRGEVQQWMGEARALREQLREQGVDARELEEIMRRMRALDAERTYRDVEALYRLQSVVAEQMKRFEFALRERAATAEGQTRLTPGDTVPAEYRTLVEEYFRTLSRPRAPQ
jgi:hypothetical protein